MKHVEHKKRCEAKIMSSSSFGQLVVMITKINWELSDWVLSLTTVKENIWMVPMIYSQFQTNRQYRDQAAWWGVWCPDSQAATKHSPVGLHLLFRPGYDSDKACLISACGMAAAQQ